MTSGEKAIANVGLFAGDSEMATLMRSHDWSATPVGAVETWSQSLKTSIRIILGSRYPMFVWWGQPMTNFYNDAYAPILGQRHPKALGQSAFDVWVDVWEVVGPQAEAVLNEGKSSWNEDLLLIMERNGYLEETYFTFSYSPVTDDDGGAGGVFCAVTEETKRVLSDRRLRTLRELAAETAKARTVESACELSVRVLANNSYDVPFALLYLLDDNGTHARLVGTTGIAVGTPASPPEIEIVEALQPPDRWLLGQAIATGEAKVIEDLVERFDPLPSGPWAESPHSAIVLPLTYSGQERPIGFLIVGISPRRALDDDYKGFFDLVATQVTTAIANARAYEAERKRAEALAQLDRAKTTFFSNISHEFRTPLTLMLGPLEEIVPACSSSLSPEHCEQLQMVQRNGLRLLKLVNTLLDFSRIEAGRSQAVYEPTDLAMLTADLAGIFRACIERAGMRLVVDCPPLPEPAYVDRQMWEKIVLNLLSNAFKFTFAGEIAVSLRDRHERIELEVRDTGTGIPTDDLPHIFERFHRVQGAKGRTYEGSGIGLSLVQELVHLHGGTIDASSAIGRGTSFTVSIPAGYAHLSSDQIGAARTLTSTATGATPYVEKAWHWLPAEDFRLPILDFRLEQTNSAPDTAQTNWQPDRSQSKIQNLKSKILLVDDNNDMRDYVKRLLLERGYDVETAVDGVAALAAVGQQVPDLVLTDVMMPQLDGLGLLRELRANPTTREIPIVLLSARAGEESRVEGLETGADDYLIKPFSARELLARVEANLKLARLRQEATQREQALRQEAETAKQTVETILSSISDGFALLDRNWCFAYINDRYCEMTGMQREEMLGQNIWDVFPDIVGDELYVRLHQAMAEQTISHYEYFYPRWNRWFENHIYPSANGLTLFVTEVSEQKIAAAALQESEERLRLASEGANLGMWYWNRETDTLIWTDRAKAMFGLPSDTEMSMQVFLEAVHPNDRPFVETIVTQLQAGQAHTEIEYRTLWADGTVRWILAKGNCDFNADGILIATRGVLLDISDRKIADEKLRQREAELKEAQRIGNFGNWHWDAKTDVTTGSDELLRIYGFDPAIDTMPNFADQDGWLYPHESWQRIHASVRQALSTGHGYELDVQAFRNGTPIWITTRSEVLRDSDGVIVGLRGTVQDITDRKITEEALLRSEERYRALTELSPQLVFMSQPDGQIAYCNQWGLEFTGRSLTQLQGDGWAECIHPDYRDRFYNAWMKATRDVCDYEIEIPFRRADGTYRWLYTRTLPVTDGTGTINYWLGVALDISDRKQVEAELRQKNAILDVVNESAPTPIFVKDRQGRIIYANPATLEVLGKSADEVIGARDCDLYPHSEDATRVMENDRHIMESGQTQVVEESPDGIRTFLGMKAPYRNEAGEVIGVIGISNDISDRVQLERDRERILQQEQAAREAAEQANRIKDEFLAVLSHELRSPLNPILGWAKLLQNGKLDEAKTKQALSTIERNAKLQSELIEDLLDVSRILQGKLSLNASSVNLTTTIRAAIETVRLAAEAKSIDLQLTIVDFGLDDVGGNPKSTHSEEQPNNLKAQIRLGKLGGTETDTATPVRSTEETSARDWLHFPQTAKFQVWGDATRLQQVVWNLLSNAVKFTSTGGRVEVRLEQVGDRAQIVVSDNGKGISLEFLPHVFDYFRQADSATTRKFGGLGLGLAIVRHLIELHGGTVQADSPGVGLGATFTVKLPLMPIGLEVVREEQSAESSLNLQGIHVLVVDDEPDTREFVAFVLEQAGARVDAAACAGEGFAALTQSKPHILVSDIGMPDIDGYMLLRQVRALPPEQGGQIKAIALSAYAGEYDRDLALRAGFQQHLAKPIEPDKLIKTIATLLGRM